jgi:hypothetical protein
MNKSETWRALYQHTKRLTTPAAIPAKAEEINVYLHFSLFDRPKPEAKAVSHFN